MTLPMIGGVFAIMAFNLTDTYFVSRLGTRPLAAISFTFPVVMVVGSIAMGLGLGLSSCISRAIGSGDSHRVQELTTYGLLLTVVLVGLIGPIGILSVDPLFHLLGAPDALMPLIRDYMVIWYACVAAIVIPMAGNNAIRATGNTLLPAMIMTISAGLNVILDPLLIFGLYGFPRLELFGAALATVLSRSISTVISVLLLHFRFHMLSWTRPHWSAVWRAWKSILHIGLPAAGMHLLLPLSRGFVTRLVAQYGTAAVAAVGAGLRIEHFAYIIPMAIGSVLIPFAGQNWGAYRADRVKEAWTKTNLFSIGYGLSCFLLSLFAARFVARLFSTDPDVIALLPTYLRIVLLASGFTHIAVHGAFMFNALGRPLSAAALSGTRLIGLIAPLAILGSSLFGLHGIFAGLALANFLAGILALVWVHRFFRRHVHTGPAGDTPPAA
jgi:putative MATE family efflux protein